MLDTQKVRFIPIYLLSHFCDFCKVWIFDKIFKLRWFLKET